MTPAPGRTLLQRLKWLLRELAMALLALLILFEEWGWDPLQRLLARVGRLPWVQRLEAAVSRQPPGAALVLLLMPFVLLLPVKLLAFWQIGQGRPLRGAVMVVLAKLLGTALMARLFTLTRPALMRWPWFAGAYPRWLGWKQALLDHVRSSRPWRLGRALLRRLRRQTAHWWQR